MLQVIRMLQNRGIYFHISWFLPTFVPQTGKQGKRMEQQEKDRIFFMDSIRDFDVRQHPQSVIHIFCTRGSMSFRFQNVNYNIVAGDYVILTNMSLASGFSESDDYSALTMGLSAQFVMSMAIRNNYGIIGHLSLLQNPVMKLSPHDFRKCVCDMERLRERLTDGGPHLFREEMLGCLMTAHILDLYDIHARGQAVQQVSEHTARLLQQFIGMLYNGEYIQHRDVPYYASRLCVTPHYLSEICRKACGRPATYWIDRFTLHEIANLLCQKELPLSEIAARLNFSSFSYFSRYVSRHFGISPNAYRESLGPR